MPVEEKTVLFIPIEVAEQDLLPPPKETSEPKKEEGQEEDK